MMTHRKAVATLAVERYLLDEMDAHETDAFERHYFECGACADEVMSADRFVQAFASFIKANQSLTH